MSNSTSTPLTQAQAPESDTPLAPSARKTPESYILPSAQAVAAAGEVQILDEEGRKFALREVWENGKERVLVVWVRHFFCGVCYFSCFSFPCVSLPTSVRDRLRAAEHCTMERYPESDIRPDV